MQTIHPKTLQDLEFPTVLSQIAARCNTELGKVDALEIKPSRHKEELMNVLGQTSEYLASVFVWGQPGKNNSHCVLLVYRFKRITMRGDNTVIYIIAGVILLHFVAGIGYLIYKLTKKK